MRREITPADSEVFTASGVTETHGQAINRRSSTAVTYERDRSVRFGFSVLFPAPLRHRLRIDSPYLRATPLLMAGTLKTIVETQHQPGSAATEETRV